MRTLIVFIIFSIALIVPNINFLLQVSGAINGTIITLIMPVMFYARAYSDSERNLSRDLASPLEDGRKSIKIFNIFVLIFGSIVSISGFAIVFKQIIYNEIQDD